MSSTVTIDIPSEWAEVWPERTYGGEPPSALAGTTVEAEYADNGELESFDVSDGHWGSPDDMEAVELEEAIREYGGTQRRTK